MPQSSKSCRASLDQARQEHSLFFHAFKHAQVRLRHGGSVTPICNRIFCLLRVSIESTVSLWTNIDEMTNLNLCTLVSFMSHLSGPLGKEIQYCWKQNHLTKLFGKNTSHFPYTFIHWKSEWRQICQIWQFVTAKFLGFSAKF